MKKVLIYLVSAVISLLVLILLVASFQPKDWKVERSVLIDAPREKVWTIVSDLNRYNEWNSYAQMDPAAKVTVVGPAATVGSSYAWDGTETGAGILTTAAIQPGERIDFKLEFTRPMAVINEASFIVGPEENPTKMTWSMRGRHEGFTGVLARAIHLFIDMDSMVGASFEAGLANLKTIAEK